MCRVKGNIILHCNYIIIIVQCDKFKYKELLLFCKVHEQTYNFTFPDTQI